MENIKQFVPVKGTKANTTELEKKLLDYKQKKVRKKIIRTFLAVVLMGMVCFLWSNSSYSSYVELNSIARVSSSDSICLNHNGKILSYSKDGISSIDSKGNVIWNETYQMQNPMVEVNGNAVAVGDYNGNTIYIMNEKGKLGEIDTNLPIRDFCVSKTGIIAVVLEDSKLTRLNLYKPDGTELVKSECRMKQNGYPIAVALSDTGEVMQVSYLYVDSGSMKSSVAFYNFSELGQNSVDRLVSGNEYANTIVPYVGFLGKDAAYAVGDNRISFYSGADKPISVAEVLLQEEVHGVYAESEYIGLAFLNTTGASVYRLDIYDKKGNLVNRQNIDFEFQHVLIHKNNVLAYNDSECIMYTLSGREKYRGSFSKSVSLLIPTTKSSRFIMVTSDSVSTIELR